MASSVSGQDEPNPLANRASYIARSGLPAVSRKNNFLKNHCDDR